MRAALSPVECHPITSPDASALPSLNLQSNTPFIHLTLPSHPSTHPFSSIHTLRVHPYPSQTDAGNRDDEGAVIMDEGTLARIALAGGVVESDIPALLSSITSTEVKDTLKATVGEALDAGAFGAPFMVVQPGSSNSSSSSSSGGGGGGGDESEEMVFFGSDRFEQMAFSLGLPWHGPNPASFGQGNNGGAKL